MSAPVTFTLERVERIEASAGTVLLRISGFWIAPEPMPIGLPVLQIHDGRATHEFPALLDPRAGQPLAEPQGSYWRGAFPVPTAALGAGSPTVALWTQASGPVFLAGPGSLQDSRAWAAVEGISSPREETDPARSRDRDEHTQLTAQLAAEQRNASAARAAAGALTRELDDARLRIEQLQARDRSAHQAVQAAEAARQELQAQLARVREEYAHREAAGDAESGELARAREELQEARRALTAAQTESAGLLERLASERQRLTSEFEQALAERTQAAERTRAQAAQAEQRHAAELAILRGQLQERGAGSGQQDPDLRRENDTLAALVEELEVGVSEAAAELAAVSERLSSTEALLARERRERADAQPTGGAGPGDGADFEALREDARRRIGEERQKVQRLTELADERERALEQALHAQEQAEARMRQAQEARDQMEARARAQAGSPPAAAAAAAAPVPAGAWGEPSPGDGPAAASAAEATSPWDTAPHTPDTPAPAVSGTVQSHPSSGGWGEPAPDDGWGGTPAQGPVAAPWEQAAAEPDGSNPWADAGAEATAGHGDPWTHAEPPADEQADPWARAQPAAGEQPDPWARPAGETPSAEHDPWAAAAPTDPFAAPEQAQGGNDPFASVGFGASAPDPFAPSAPATSAPDPFALPGATPASAGAPPTAGPAGPPPTAAALASTDDPDGEQGSWRPRSPGSAQPPAVASAAGGGFLDRLPAPVRIALIAVLVVVFLVAVYSLLV